MRSLLGLTTNAANQVSLVNKAFNGTSTTTDVKFGSGVTEGAEIGIAGLRNTWHVPHLDIHILENAIKYGYTKDNVADYGTVAIHFARAGFI